MEDKVIRNELLALINYMFEHEEILDKTFESENSELLEKILDFDRKTQDLSRFPIMDVLLYLCTIDEHIQK